MAFADKFPETILNLHVEALGAVPEAVLEQRCRVGIMGSLPIASMTPLRAERLFIVPFVTVVGAGSPMAKLGDPIPEKVASRFTQLTF